MVNSKFKLIMIFLLVTDIIYLGSNRRKQKVSIRLLSKSKVELKNYVEVDGCKYFVDNKNVIFETSNKELAIATWLSEELNKTIGIVPVVKQPEGIKTSDYMIDNEYWDLKEISSNRKDAVYTRIRSGKNQTTNFIIEISKSKMTMKSARKQVEALYEHKNYKWLNKIIIKRHGKIEFIKRK